MAKPRLRGLPIGVDEDRTPRQQAEHFRLVTLMKEARAEKKHARIIGGRLFVNGAVMTPTNASMGAASPAAAAPSSSS